MINNLARIGNFTSSEIAALMTVDRSGKNFGKPALTYIQETNYERKLGRSLTDETNARPLTWGKLMEIRAFDQLGLEYILSSTETTVHPTIPYWAGSKDGMKMDKGRTVIDIKAPITLKSFCQLVDPLYDGLTGMEAMNAVRENHKDGDKFYWQITSNAILEGAQYGELVVYMPYKSELEDIKMMAHNVDGDKLSRHLWIAMAAEDELPYLPDGGFYKNINIIRFEIPQVDKDALTANVLKAAALLIGNEKMIPLERRTSVESAFDTSSIKLQKIK